MKHILFKLSLIQVLIVIELQHAFCFLAKFIAANVMRVLCVLIAKSVPKVVFELTLIVAGSGFELPVAVGSAVFDGADVIVAGAHD